MTSQAQGVARAAAGAGDVHLDTHVVVWLYTDPLRAWPMRVQQVLESAALWHAPMVRLELQYLHEIGRLRVPPAVLLADLLDSVGLRECPQPFSRVVSLAESIGWTRDVFDRLIVAQAMAAGARLISRDGVIREHFGQVLWDG